MSISEEREHNMAVHISKDSLYRISYRTLSTLNETGQLCEEEEEEASLIGIVADRSSVGLASKVIRSEVETRTNGGGRMRHNTVNQKAIFQRHFLGE